MYRNVFISYAKEDIVEAKKLFDFLEGLGYDPWLDKVKLLPGQDWNREIRLALKKADFIVLLLSKTSVAKRGFVQREFKLALEYCEEKLDSDIYVIPCKIDDCTVPEKLLKYQWVELNNSDSFTSIFTSLELQRNKYIQDEKLRIALNTSFEFKEIKIEKSVGEKPRTHLEIVYPKFTDSSNEDLVMLNSYIEHPILMSYNSSLNINGSDLFPQDSFDSEYPFPDNALSLNYKFELLTKSIISYTIFNYSYSGGAHGLYGTAGYSYSLNTLQKIDLRDLLENDSNVLVTLKKLCKEKLLAKAQNELDILSEEEFFLNPDALNEEWETYSNFYLQKRSVVIIFSIYQLTAYALGQHEVFISYEELLVLHDNLITLRRLQELLKD